MVKYIIFIMAVTALAIDGATFSKRQIGFTGGFSPASVDDAEVKKMADFATTAISSNSNSGPVKLIKIVKAETQVVAGKNYKLNLELSSEGNAAPLPCEVVIFDQPWSNTRKMIKSSCTPKKRITREKIIQELPIEGDFTTLKVDSVEAKTMADFATTAIMENTNSGPVRLTKIVQAKFQQVAGKNYELILELATVGGESAPILCEAVVFDQSSTNTRKLSQSKCAPIKRNSTTEKVAAVNPGILPIAGGYSPANVTDAKIKEIASFASTILSNNANGVMTVTKIIKAETQVVAGQNYKLTLELASDNSKIYTCEVVVFDQSWTNTRKVTQSICKEGAGPIFPTA